MVQALAGDMFREERCFSLYSGADIAPMPAPASTPAPEPALAPVPATSNATARPMDDPHGNGVRFGESEVPVPSDTTGSRGAVEATEDMENVLCMQLEGHSDRSVIHGLDFAVCGSKANGGDSGPTAQVMGFPVVIPPDGVPVAHASSITSPETLATGASPHAALPEISRICRTPGCARRGTDTEHGNHTVCCDTCSSTDGRFHTSVCGAADYALDVSSSSTVSTLERCALAGGQVGQGHAVGCEAGKLCKIVYTALKGVQAPAGRNTETYDAAMAPLVR